MNHKLRSTPVPHDPPPLNRRIYDGSIAWISGVLSGAGQLFGRLKVPALFAVLLTLYLMSKNDQAAGWYFTTVSGYSWLFATLIVSLVAGVVAYAVLRFLAWFVTSLLR